MNHFLHCIHTSWTNHKCECACLVQYNPLLKLLVHPVAIVEQECIPVGCGLSAHYRKEGSPWQSPARQRLHPGQRPPGQRPPGQRPPWTETPLWTDKHLWKHYLRKLRLRTVINQRSDWIFTPFIAVFFFPFQFLQTGRVFVLDDRTSDKRRRVSNNLKPSLKDNENRRNNLVYSTMKIEHDSKILWNLKVQK